MRLRLSLYHRLISSHSGNKRGRCFMIVTATGLQTFVGRTASLVTGADRQGHFKKVMNSIGATLLFFVIAFGLAFWIGGFFRNVDIATPQEKCVIRLWLAP